MKCTNCGTEIKKGIFCPQCGMKLLIDEPKGSSVESEKKGYAEKASEEKKCSQGDSAPETKSRNVDRRAIGALIIGIVSCIVVSKAIIRTVGAIIAILGGVKALKSATKYKKSAFCGIILGIATFAILFWGGESSSSNNSIGETNAPESGYLEEIAENVDIAAWKELTQYDLDHIEPALYYCTDGGIQGMNLAIYFNRDTIGDAYLTAIVYIGNDAYYKFGEDYYFNGEIFFVEGTIYGISSYDKKSIVLLDIKDTIEIKVVKAENSKLYDIEGKYAPVVEEGDEGRYITVEYKKTSVSYNSDVTIFVDDVEIGTISAGDTKSFLIQLDVGKHKIQVISDGWIRDRKSNKLKFEVQKEDTEIIFNLQDKSWSGLKIKIGTE